MRWGVSGECYLGRFMLLLLPGKSIPSFGKVLGFGVIGADQPVLDTYARAR